MVIFLSILQLISGLIILIGVLSQISQIIKTKSSRDVSLNSYLLFCIANILSEFYLIGLALSGSGIIVLITNTLISIMDLICVFLIMKYRKKS